MQYPPAGYLHIIMILLSASSLCYHMLFGLKTAGNQFNTLVIEERWCSKTEIFKTACQDYVSIINNTSLQQWYRTFSFFNSNHTVKYCIFNAGSANTHTCSRYIFRKTSLMHGIFKKQTLHRTLWNTLFYSAIFTL